MFDCEPYDFWVVVSLVDFMIVGPLVILGRVDSNRLTVLLQIIIGVIGKSQPIVVKGSLFLNAEVSGVWEVVDGHLDHIFKQVLVINWSDTLVLEMDYVDFTLSNVENDDFLVVHLAKSVNNVVVSLFEKYFTLGVEVDNTLLLAGLVHSDHDKSVFVCSGNSVHLREGFIKLDCCLLLQQHIYKLIIELNIYLIWSCKLISAPFKF